MGDEQMIPLNKPFFSQETKDLVNYVLDSGMVSQGKMVETFEEIVRKYVGAKYAVAVSSCTAGMVTTLLAKKKYYNNVILTSPFTFPAIQSITKFIEYDDDPYVEQLDVNVSTYNIEIELIRKYARSYRWNLTMPIHQFGMPCDMNEINEISDKTKAVVIQDAACALGSEYKGTKIGSSGTAVFSFHGRKIITTGEGGMVVTDDEELYKELVQMRQFGRNKDGEFVGRGLNFKMSDVQAAMGIGQMEYIDALVKERRAIASIYDEYLETLGITPPYKGIDTVKFKTNYQSYVVRLPEVKDITKVIDHMRNAGVEAQIGSYDNSNGRCKVSAELARTTVALPIWPGMGETEIAEVMMAFKTAVGVCGY